MGVLETFAGPTIGEFSRLTDLYLKARDAALSPDEQVEFSDFLTFGLRNVPYVNLFYTRVALDFLIINSLREVASPGYLRRKDERQMREYGQHYLGRKYHLKPFGK